MRFNRKIVLHKLEFFLLQTLQCVRVSLCISICNNYCFFSAISSNICSMFYSFILHTVCWRCKRFSLTRILSVFLFLHSKAVKTSIKFQCIQYGTIQQSAFITKFTAYYGIFSSVEVSEKNKRKVEYYKSWY